MGTSDTIDGIKLASVTSSDSFGKGPEDAGQAEAAAKGAEEGSTALKSVSFSELLRRVTPRLRHCGALTPLQVGHGPEHADVLTASNTYCHTAKHSSRIKLLWRWVCWRQL